MISKINDLKEYRLILTKQEIRTLKGQIKSGDIQGAEKGLNKILNKKGISLNEYNLQKN